ncbi:MAG: cache domain-containing protein [Candidatus Nitrosocosmicus sp.]|nr:cache domain-containing protein [Candidatus Nitrosocosmicus sp.]
MDKVKKIGIISVILILSLSVGLLIYNQSITEESVRDRFIEEEKERQLESTKSISNHIQSDLNLVITMLDGLATSKYFQEGDLMGTEPETLLKEKYSGYNEIVNRLFVIDKDGVVRMSLAPRGTETFLGQDFSLRNWVRDTKTNLSLTLSGGFERQGIYREFITYPIVNRESNEYLGMVGAAIPTEPFFAKYGNVELGDRQFLVAFDRSGTILANGADKKLMGQNYFGDYVQDFINRNSILNNLTRALMMGNPGYAIYDYGRGERLTTQSPVIIGDRPEFFIQIVTPTDQIHSQIRHVISAENIKMITLFTSTFAAVVVLIILLAKWNNTLIKEVEKKTRELFEAEKRRKEIEESLESMKEYVNDVLKEAKTAMDIRRFRGFGGRKSLF